MSEKYVYKILEEKPSNKLADQQLLRLENLLRVMKTVAKKPKAAYDIASWGHKYSSINEMEEDLGISKEEAPPCKTVACTAGWAGTDPFFRRRGLQLNLIKQTPILKRYPAWYESDMKVPEVPGASEYEEGGQFSDRLQYFFGLTQSETNQLFFSGPESMYHPTAKDIVKYLSKDILPKYRKLAKEAKKVGKK